MLGLPLFLRALQRLEFPKKLGICERLFAKSLSQYGISWVQTAAGLRWKLDLTNATHRWIVYGKYEGAPFLDWARHHLPEDGIIVDSGANIGQMLLYFAQWVPQGHVFAIEPGEHQADWLSECLRANLQLPVTLIRIGLGEIPQNAFLRETGTPDRHGSWSQVSQTEGEPIQITPLHEILESHLVERVDLWKLDVEGHEIPALKGAESWLGAHKIRAVYVELDGDNGRRIIRYLGELGYQLHVFQRNGRLRQTEAMGIEHMYGLFLPDVAA